MSFLPSAGYGGAFGYTGANVRTDGWEPKHFAGTVMRKAFSELVFSRLGNESTDAFGVGQGGTFTVPIAQDFGQPTSISALTSGTAITLGTQKWDSVTMVMNEYGTGIAYERILDWFSAIPVQNQLITSLSNHVSRAINLLDFQVLNSCKFAMEVPAAGSYSTILGTNRAGISQATMGELGMGGLALLCDSFKVRVVSPFNRRGMFGLVANSETLRNLIQGSVFQNRELYNSLQGITYSVLGDFMNFTAITTEEQMTKGTAFALGLNTFGFGFGKQPSVTFYPDFGQDAGRLPVWKVLWYRGQDAIWRDKGTACVMIRCTTGAYNYGALG